MNITNYVTDPKRILTPILSHQYNTDMMLPGRIMI